jgi:hypothetical protein
MMRVVVTRDRAMASAAAAAPLRAMPRCRARRRDAATPPSTSGRDDARPRRAASSVVAPRQTKNAGGATTTRGTTISARGARGGFDPFASSPAIARDDPFADAATPAAADDDAAAAALPRVDWTVEVRVTEGKFAGYTLLCSAFIDDDVPRVADLLLGSGMAGFPLERRTLETYLRGAVPAFPYGTYLVGRLRAPRVGVGGGGEGENFIGDDDDGFDDGSPPGGPASSWSEEKSSAHGPIVCTVGVSFNAATRRRFTSLSPPTDQAYLSDLVVFESERGARVLLPHTGPHTTAFAW